MRDRRLLHAALGCFGIGAVVFSILMTNIDTALSNWIILYNRTPPAATAVLYLGAAWGIWRNNSDAARWLAIVALWGAAAVYFLLQWPPDWWVLYGRSVFRLAFTLLPLSLFTLSLHRRLKTPT